MLNENRILRKNVKDLQGQLTNANIRISRLTEELHQVKKELNPFNPINSDSNWAELPSENPDALHVKEEEEQFNLNLNKGDDNDTGDSK
jgi:hypothetical protein